MDDLIQTTQRTVLAQLRPMVVTVAKGGFIDAKGLDRIEVEARRLVGPASGGRLRLREIRRDEAARRGYLVMILDRVQS